MASRSCGIEALTFGSLTMLASGLFARSPSSARSSLTRSESEKISGKLARIRAANEMSLDSTETPAAPA